MKTIKNRDDYNTTEKCTWCSGCGNYSIWYMLKQALLELEIDPHKVVIVYGVGCSGNGANFTDVYAFHGLHGRALPVAEGIKLVNPDIKVIVMGGDGDGLGIGVGHFIHAARRNIDITYLLHDNQIYGLTTGQTSPRSDVGMVTKSTPFGNIEDPVNPISLALTSHATFVARTFSGLPHYLKDIIKKAILHKGFSFVDIMQPCITFNKLNTYAWYNERIIDINKEENFDSSNFEQALVRSLEFGDKIPIGIFFDEDREDYYSKQALDFSPLTKNLNKPLKVENILKNFSV